MRVFLGIEPVGVACFGLALALAGNSQAQDPGTSIAPTNHIELFNGKDLTGWKFIARTNGDSSQTWTVTNGVIHCTGKPAGYVRTEKNYRDCKLTVEWRFVKVAPKADNTGVLVHIGEPDKVWPRCIQCQGQLGKQGDLFMMSGADCREHQGMQGDRLPMRGPSNEKPAGEWNICEMVCARNAVKAYFNGKLMNEATECNISSGRIGFQSEGAEFEIRRVSLDPVEAQ